MADSNPTDPELGEAAVDLLELRTDRGAVHVALHAPVVRIGRAVDNDIVLADETTVSRSHAELLRDDTGVWSVRDLGSSNGTYLNGQPVGAGLLVALTADDLLGFGSVTGRLVQSEAPNGQTVMSTAAADVHRLVTSLSAREREVLTQVATGKTDDQVASALFISVKTVHSHLDKIREKTGARRRAELTRLAMRLGMGSDQ
jgi:DNA-binding CsgD family transcriptional regulator